MSDGIVVLKALREGRFFFVPNAIFLLRLYVIATFKSILTRVNPEASYRRYLDRPAMVEIVVARRHCPSQSALVTAMPKVSRLLSCRMPGGNVQGFVMMVEKGKLLRMSAVAMCAFALAACGGGDDNSGSSGGTEKPAGTSTGTTGGTTGKTGDATGSGSTPPPEPAIVPGKVDGPFVAGSQARYMSVGLGTLEARLTGVSQEASGAFTTIGPYRVVDGSRVGAMSGNASFALGSWAGKIANATTGIEVTAPNGLAYAVFNPLVTMPADGTLDCKPYVTSAPAAIGAGEALTGTATLTITQYIPTVSVDLKLTEKNGGEAPIKFEKTYTDPAELESTSSVELTGGAKSDLSYRASIGAGANNGVVIVLPWQLTGGSKTRVGIAVLDCKRPA